MRFLIIGGTGFIGPYAVARLIERGHEVTVFHRGLTEPELPPGVRHLHHPATSFGDRTYFHDFREAFMGLSPDVVIDMIAFTQDDAATLVETFRGIAKRVIVLSSQDVYRAYGRFTGHEPGEPEPLPLDEMSPLRDRYFPYRGEQSRVKDDPGRWMDEYDKILVERGVMSDQELPATILRLPMVYGPGDRQHRIFDVLIRMQDGRPAILLNEKLARWRWTRGYVENIADALVLVAENEEASGQIFNVGEVDALTMQQWVQVIGQAAGWEGRIIPVAQDKLPRHLQVHQDTRQSIVADTKKIRLLLDYQERVPRLEGLARTIEWERNHPPATKDQIYREYIEEDRLLKELAMDE